MSINTVEAFLHKVGNDRDAMESFMAEPDSVLSKYTMTDEERRSILEWDLHAIVDSGVSPMALMFAYVAAHGGPDKARDPYIKILNGPKPTRAAAEV